MSVIGKENYRSKERGTFRFRKYVETQESEASNTIKPYVCDFVQNNY